MNVFTWCLTILTVLIFWNDFLYPYLHNKYNYLKFKRAFKKMSKKYDGETKEQLEEIASLFEKAYKDEKLGDDDED